MRPMGRHPMLALARGAGWRHGMPKHGMTTEIDASAGGSQARGEPVARLSE
jgi:hypothetical protein